MTYEEMIRKIFKNYKSKRELKCELEAHKNDYKIDTIKTTKTTCEIIPIKCIRTIPQCNINYLNKEARDIVYKRIDYEIKREMFEYIINNDLIKMHRQFNVYDNAEEFIAYLEVVR